LPGGDAPALMAPAREQEVTGLPAERPQVAIDGFPRLIGQFEPDGMSGFPLSDTGTSDGSAMRGNIFNLDADDVAATELAIDSEIEHGEVTDLGIGAEL
jgi:hypothetical protein